MKLRQMPCLLVTRYLSTGKGNGFNFLARGASDNFFNFFNSLNLFCRIRGSVQLHLLEHCQQAVGTGGGEVVAQADAVDEI